MVKMPSGKKIPIEISGADSILTSINNKIQSKKKTPIKISGADSVLTLCAIEIFLLKIELLFFYFFFFFSIPFSGIPLGDHALSY
jgi:hypothetical protein